MSATSTETPAEGRVFFQAAPGSVSRDEPAQKRQGKVTVKYDRKELRKRLHLEEWIVQQLSALYDCEPLHLLPRITQPTQNYI
uniref:Protein phosphatase 1 regulatory subunit 14B n=1 Tax=Denticeps clupeoides TaxID=299321 RepID=A0AAY4CM83_9TELE